MTYMCKPVPKENVVTMYDARVAELEHLLMEAEANYARADRMHKNTEERYLNDTNILASVLYNIMSSGILEKHHLDMAIENSAYDSTKIISTLEYHDAVPEDMLHREYYVSITVPVTVCVTVEAANMDDAQEMASDYVDSNGLEYYDMQYDSHYNAEYEVEEA